MPSYTGGLSIFLPYSSNTTNMPRQITIEPVTRVEGHGKVTIRLDDNGQVTQSRLHIVEFRGFERFIQGRPYWEAPVLVQRLCGICPVSHHLAAGKAMDAVVGVTVDHPVTATADKLRRLMHYAQVFQSHALHFFYLASPDLLFGTDAPPRLRNVFGVSVEHRELAIQGIRMRQFGQEVIAATAGKRIHGTGCVPGGMNRGLTQEQVDHFLHGEGNIATMKNWAQEGLAFFRHYHRQHRDFIDQLARFPSNHLSLVRRDGALDLYDGVLRSVDNNGRKILDDVDCHDYDHYIAEGVKSWSYMKFPYLLALGPERGWYRVGPMARLGTCDYIPTPLAQAALDEYRRYTHGKPGESSMYMHWARLIEILHTVEVMEQLLLDPDITGTDLKVDYPGRSTEGIGVIEAPRGTLIHHYRVGDDDLITMANLIVATTHNNEAMNRAVELIAREQLSGQAVITEAMTNTIEVGIRAYDPCLSCATHALGQMPLEIVLEDATGRQLQHLITPS